MEQCKIVAAVVAATAASTTEVVATCSKASNSVVFTTMSIYVLTEQYNGQLQSQHESQIQKHPNKQKVRQKWNTGQSEAKQYTAIK